VNPLPCASPKGRLATAPGVETRKEEHMQMDVQRMAELGYSERYGKLELVLPHGTKSEEFGKISERLFSDFVARLPRGCQACLSGESFLVRERLAHVLQIDLESMEIVGKG
jgi:hypothetical protein